MIKDKVNHIFMGHSWLLVSQMIEKITRYSKFSHHFVVIINDYDQKEKYENLFKKLKIDDYEYWNYICSENDSTISLSHLKRQYLRLLFSGVLVRFEYIKRWLLIYEKIQQSHFSNVIIHSEINDLALFFRRKPIKLAWCCWGGIPNFKKPKFYKYLRKNYHYRAFLDNCYYIITLTENDKKAFEERYGYKNVLLTSYSYIYDFDKLLSNSKHVGNNVVIGNSIYYIDDYSKAANILKNYNGLEITFMCSYGIDLSSTKYKNWQSSIIKKLEPANKVRFWTENVDIDEFHKRLSKFNVYISPVTQRQSGIGTITSAIGLGLKCYLAGVNLDYFKKKQLKVFPYNEIPLMNAKEIFSFDKDSRLYNMHSVKDVCGVYQSVVEWDDIYRKLCND